MSDADKLFAACMAVGALQALLKAAQDAAELFRRGETIWPDQAEAENLVRAVDSLTSAESSATQ